MICHCTTSPGVALLSSRFVADRRRRSERSPNHLVSCEYRRTYGATGVLEATMVICPNCQTPNDDDAKFCTNCGTALADAAPTTQAPAADAPPPPPPGPEMHKAR